VRKMASKYNNLEQAYKELYEAYKILKAELDLLNGKRLK